MIHTFTGHSGKVYTCKISPDSKVALTGSTDRKIMQWDMQTGYRLKTILCGSICNSLDISDDGSLIVSGHQDRSIRLWGKIKLIK